MTQIIQKLKLRLFPVKEPKPPPEKDEIEKAMGTFGRWHLWICFVIFLVKFPVAWHQLSIVIEGPPADFKCADEGLDGCSPNCSRHEFNRTIFEETIITQWDLVCERAQLANLAQLITMLGILFGNMVFGILSDKYDIFFLLYRIRSFLLLYKIFLCRRFSLMLSIIILMTVKDLMLMDSTMNQRHENIYINFILLLCRPLFICFAADAFELKTNNNSLRNVHSFIVHC